MTRKMLDKFAAAMVLLVMMAFIVAGNGFSLHRGTDSQVIDSQIDRLRTLNAQAGTPLLPDVSVWTSMHMDVVACRKVAGYPWSHMDGLAVPAVLNGSEDVQGYRCRKEDNNLSVVYRAVGDRIEINDFYEAIAP